MHEITKLKSLALKINYTRFLLNMADTTNTCKNRKVLIKST